MGVPDISVLMPCYNASRWVGTALCSILRQTYHDIEILVCDDGSTDDTAKVIGEVASRDRRVVVYTGPNQGIVGALNGLLGEAKGKFIARMDADDICCITRLERQMAFLEQSGSDLCGTWFTEFGQGIPRTVRWPHGHESVRTSLMFQNSICHPTILARREVFECFRYRQEYLLAEDYDLFVRASLTFKLDNLSEVLLRYRRHPAQATQDKRDRMEQVTQSIRQAALKQQGIDASTRDLQLHQMIRAPTSIRSTADLLGIEQWLSRILEYQSNDHARLVVASQWVRACIRAAPLGAEMYRIFRQSPLRRMAGTGSHMDLRALSILRLDYASRPFHFLRRFGLSA